MHWLWRSWCFGVVRVAVFQDQSLSLATAHGLLTSSLPQNHSIIYSFPCDRWHLYVRKSQARLMAFSHHAIFLDSIYFLYVVLVSVWRVLAALKFIWGFHKHVAPIWLSQNNPVLSLVCASGNAWVMVYLFVEGNFYHICLGNYMYSVPSVLICFLFYSYSKVLSVYFVFW
jgi:hypothetical protein